MKSKAYTVVRTVGRGKTVKKKTRSRDGEEQGERVRQEQ